MRQLLSGIDRYWYAPLPALRLGYLRLLAGVYSLVYLLIWSPNFLVVSSYPKERFAPVGPVVILSLPLPPLACAVAFALTVILGAAFCLGWRFRWLGPAYAVSLLWTTSYRNSWGMLFHSENLMTLHVLLLSLTPAASSLSLDARLAQREHPTDHGRYGWGIRALSAVTVAVYLLAGVAKVRASGLGWASGEVLQNQVAFDNLRKIELGSWHSPLGAWLAPWRSVFSPLAGISLFLELAAPLALFGPRVARCWALGVWLFHWGILALMAIAFAYPLSGVAFLCFLRPEQWKILRFVQRWFEGAPRAGRVPP
ncbi:MAG: HTTM domain-containing protein [Polyangiaceae bacterium]|nr:HTTM domain-containing protein [Polyangiaceae bacterium]